MIRVLLDAAAIRLEHLKSQQGILLRGRSSERRDVREAPAPIMSSPSHRCVLCYRLLDGEERLRPLDRRTSCLAPGPPSRPPHAPSLTAHAMLRPRAGSERRTAMAHGPDPCAQEQHLSSPPSSGEVRGMRRHHTDANRNVEPGCEDALGVVIRRRARRICGLAHAASRSWCRRQACAPPPAASRD